MQAGGRRIEFWWKNQMVATNTSRDWIGRWYSGLRCAAACYPRFDSHTPAWLFTWQLRLSSHSSPEEPCKLVAKGSNSRGKPSQSKGGIRENQPTGQHQTGHPAVAYRACLANAYWVSLREVEQISGRWLHWLLTSDRYTLDRRAHGA
jgi:hypothetical protein